MITLKHLWILLILVNFVAKSNERELIREPSEGGCKFTIQNDVPENEPVYLLEDNSSGMPSFLKPQSKINYLRENDSILMFCPGSRNTVQINNNADNNLRGQQNTTKLECNRNGKFELGTNNRIVQFNKINCTKEVMGDLRTTTKKCGSGVINEIGFRLNSRYFVKLFETCYNNQTASAIYSKYFINGKAIKFNVKESERRSFRSNGVPSGINPNDLYKRANQVKNFNNLFGRQQKFINDTSYLSRGHLAADADFVFSSAQFATYFYTNVAPQFQAINGGNWLRVENIARNLAMNYETELTVYTGTIGQLRLPNQSGDQIAMFMEDDKIVVPLWFYKIIIDEEADSAIVFVTSNNPFLHRNAVRPFCSDVCERSGLSMKQFQDTRKGFTFCCNYAEFIDDVDIFPRNNYRVNKLLSCANIELPDEL